jgi:DNA-binding winged helix-turn-helix (wHTH) protein/phage shock protein PspC (stress-responsive transcriptional regulator)
MHPVLKYRFADFEADLKAAELRRDGIRLKVQMQPFQVLVALLERPHDVVTREELRQRLWPEDTFVDFDHGLNTAMAKLRDVLGDSAAKPRYIETIAKRGYRFLGEVSSVPLPVTAPVQEAALPLPQLPVLQPSIAQTRAAFDMVVTESPTDAELPRASRRTARVLFVLAQVMYLAFYISALFDLPKLSESSYNAWHNGGRIIFVVYLVTALVGVAVRLYLITATAFDYHLFAEKYRVIFPALFLLDMLWAFSPLLIADRIGLGLALGSTAALIYMPFAQRVLVRMTGKNRVIG